MLNKSIYIILISVVILLTASCSTNQSIEISVDYYNTAKKNYDAAQILSKEGDYQRARKFYQHIIRKFSTSPRFITLAELGMADCDFGEEMYLESAIKYRQFIERHPSHSKVEYALYKRGLSYFNMIPEDWFILPPTVEKDQTAARDAYRQLKSFVKHFPDSVYSGEVKKMLNTCIDKITNHDMYVADFYLKRDNFRGALMRCKNVYTNYPETISAGKALLFSGKIFLQLRSSENSQYEMTELQRLWGLKIEKGITPYQFFTNFAKQYFSKVIENNKGSYLEKQAELYMKTLR